MKGLIVAVTVAGMFIGTVLYDAIGVSTRVEEIKERAPSAMELRGWEILRYEGYELGSFNKHGGKVWYHVRNINDHSIQYRVQVTLWGGELHYYYNGPESVSRLNVTHPSN